MSFAIIYSRANVGIEARQVTVEVDVANGLPRLSIVGLPETAVKESKDRVRSALLNSQFEFPAKRITINLAPADLPKEGTRFDLPIALGIIAATKQIPKDVLAEYEFVGELALSGELRPINGILPFSLATSRAQRKLILPQGNVAQACLVREAALYPAEHLLDICAHLSGKDELTPSAYQAPPLYSFQDDLSDVRGQVHAKRALEIAAVGGHSLLMVGPPGTGKTMLANRMCSILPELSEEMALQQAVLNSLTGKNINTEMWLQPPFRSPHHTASAAALVGGGRPPGPGEISLAHNGVLFLDELPEFPRHVIETLREPLESRRVNISRAGCQVEFPANFQLITAMNPCPCGYLGDERGQCHCSSEQVARYLTRLSGPLLDRIDMHIPVRPLEKNELFAEASENLTESSAIVRARVIAAREKQMARSGQLNAHLNTAQLQKFCKMQPAVRTQLEKAVERFNLSARSCHRILRVARSIADLADQADISLTHLNQAIQYRQQRIRE